MHHTALLLHSYGRDQPVPVSKLLCCPSALMMQQHSSRSATLVLGAHAAGGKALAAAGRCHAGAAAPASAWRRCSSVAWSHRAPAPRQGQSQQSGGQAVRRCGACCRSPHSMPRSTLEVTSCYVQACLPDLLPSGPAAWWLRWRGDAVHAQALLCQHDGMWC